MKRTFRQLRNDIIERLKRIGERELERTTLPHSKTIATTYEARVIRAQDSDAARIYSPYFWSGFLDLGRGPVYPSRASLLVWYRNPERDDPRLRGGYPRSRSAQRKLTAAEYKRGLRINKLYEAAGREPFMIVSRGADGFVGKGFTEAARPSVERQGRAAVREELQDWLSETLSDLPKGRADWSI